MKNLKILILYQKEWGRRIIKNILRNKKKSWSVSPIKINVLPDIVDDVNPYLPRKIDRANLIIALGEQPSFFDLLPEITSRSLCKSVIIPVDNYSHVPLGLQKELKEEFKKKNVHCIFPRPFCSLSTGPTQEMREFSAVFGKPKLKIEVKNNQVKNVEVLRSAPCGSTLFVAKKLVGQKIEGLAEKAGLYVQLYPCLASRKINRVNGDSLIHLSGLILKREVIRSLSLSKSF